MSGTDHLRREDEVPPGPVFILVGPQMGENIGAAARAMWNFGLDRLRLVAPRDGWPNPRAEAVASGAGLVLSRVQVFGSVAEACADLALVFATTARDRAFTRRVLTPEHAMREARGLVAGGEKLGVLFGPERAGLENEDVARAGAVVSIPVNPAFGSLNLAQGVLILAYEWMRSAHAAAGEVHALAGGRLATGVEMDHFLQHLTERLDAVGFFFPEHKRESMRMRLEGLFRRAALTEADIRTLHGIVRALAVKAPGRK